MAASNGSTTVEDLDGSSRTIDFDLQEGGYEDGNFRTENDPNDPEATRQDVISRKGRVAVSCFCKDVVHGYESDDKDDLCSIIVLYFRFESRENDHRIKKVEVKVTFSPRTKGDPDPIVDGIYPEDLLYAQPKTHHETVNTSTGGKVGASLGPGEAAVDLKRDVTTERDREDMMKVQGDKDKEGRNYGLPNSVVWTLRENKLDESGVPISMQAAIRLKRKDMSKFQAHFTMKVTPDWLTSVKSVLTKNPKDDPVFFDPAKECLNETRHDYDTDNLGAENLEDLSRVTVSTTLQQVARNRNQKE